AGKTLGKVTVQDLIARGGMAEVYTGTHESFGQVAVKVMRGLLEQDTDQLARFQREAEVIEDLRHPNIVQMFDYALVDESPYLVMEYIPGPSLAVYLKRLHDNKQRLPIGVIAHILKSIASALDYAHLKGLVHRDIKPANVLLRSHTEPVALNKTLPLDVEPVLTDFGLVRLLDSTMLTTAGSVSGTPTYMSPEQARGEKVDKRTDIYSLGIMLYEMLAGTVPFQADTTFGMLMKHINEPPPPIKGVSSDLQALIDRTLAKDPALRYDSAGELADEFIALFNGQTISPGTLHIAEIARQANEAGQQGKIPPQERRSNRWLRIGIEIAVILILAFLIYRFVGPSSVTAVNPNAPIGRMRFSDFANVNDRISFTLTEASQPGANTHYEAWLVSDDGKTFRDVGTINFDASGAGQLVFTDADGKNLLQDFNQIQITKEQDKVAVSKPTGAVVYSSIFPSKALAFVRAVEVAYPDVPNSLALMQGLYYYSGSYVNTPINGDQVNDPTYVSIVKAYDDKDEATIRKDTEEVINQIVGDASDQYKDYDQDGTVDTYSSDGFGSLPNGEHTGYLQETALQLKSAADAADSTANIRQQSAYIQVCIQNMTDWTNQMLPLALKLNSTPYGPEMKPIIDELSKLGEELVNGADTNGNGLVEPIAGECGAGKAYEYGWYMADFPIYTGPNRVPPTGK
ncbi:MAG TPA: serine/threonine-protein kinase, partial [Anaerolineales bacterium]|nr:serine/threonine-protein kinase [Anaerolineales bacterium]